MAASEISRCSSNNLTLHHPALAAELGRRIDSKVPGAADRLNAILAEGRETREALQETRQILDALEQSIKEIDNGN
jgi:hypothetical protein